MFFWLFILTENDLPSINHVYHLCYFAVIWIFRSFELKITQMSCKLFNKLHFVFAFIHVEERQDLPRKLDAYLNYIEPISLMALQGGTLNTLVA